MDSSAHNLKGFFAAPIVVFVASLSALSNLSTRAQSPVPAPPFGPTHIGGPEPKAEDEYRRTNPTLQPGLGPPREARVLKKGLLAPSPQDLADNVTSLRRFDTGIIKLLPREIFDGPTYHTEKRPKIRGGGAYYSFFYLSHQYGYGSDLELDHDTFSVGFTDVDYGMLKDLGDVPLEEISVSDPRAAFMAAYEAARNEPDARCEFMRFREGTTLNGALYKGSLPAKVNSTYLLRSINYGRSDLLVRFRVTRQETDGSVIIVWKILWQFSLPHFEKVLYVNPINKCPIR